MIRTMFLAKTDYERLKRNDALPDFVAGVVTTARDVIAIEDARLLAAAGFPGEAPPVRSAAVAGYWIDGTAQAPVREALARISESVLATASALSADQRRLVDYAIVTEAGIPPIWADQSPTASASGSQSGALQQPLRINGPSHAV